MRLVPRRIEVAQAEREVDRVDVFERRGERRKVRREIQRRQIGQNRLAKRATRSDRTEADTFIQAAHPIPLQVDRDVLVADRAQLADDPIAHVGLERARHLVAAELERAASVS